MNIKAELLLASMNAHTGDVLYTFVVTAPRIILSEINTHRTLSRNTASSRAVPAKKIRSMVLKTPFIPTSFGANKKGMQAGEELTGWKRKAGELVWRGARYPAVAAHIALEKLGIHKQITNRVVEPWLYIQQLISATELDNFFLLRDHPDAEPHFQELARQMHLKATNARNMLLKGLRSALFLKSVGLSSGGVIQYLSKGEWHLPFVLDEEKALPLETRKKISAARCARVSYYLPDGQLSDVTSDLDRFQRLAGSDPKHLSPLEHQATPLRESVYCGNFKGWKQFRKEVPNEAGLVKTS
jgi:hypothetical protein